MLDVESFAKNAKAQGYSDDDIKNYIAKNSSSDTTGGTYDSISGQTFGAQPNPNADQGSGIFSKGVLKFLADQIPTAAGIGGLVLGAPLGPLGSIGGGALGQGAGEGVKELLEGKKLKSSDIFNQGLIGGATGVAGPILGKAGELVGGAAKSLPVIGPLVEDAGASSTKALGKIFGPGNEETATRLGLNNGSTDTSSLIKNAQNAESNLGSKYADIFGKANQYQEGLEFGKVNDIIDNSFGRIPEGVEEKAAVTKLKAIATNLKDSYSAESGADLNSFLSNETKLPFDQVNELKKQFQSLAKYESERNTPISVAAKKAAASLRGEIETGTAKYGNIKQVNSDWQSLQNIQDHLGTLQSNGGTFTTPQPGGGVPIVSRFLPKLPNNVAGAQATLQRNAVLKGVGTKLLPEIGLQYGSAQANKDTSSGSTDTGTNTVADLNSIDPDRDASAAAAQNPFPLTKYYDYVSRDPNNKAYYKQVYDLNQANQIKLGTLARIDDMIKLAPSAKQLGLGGNLLNTAGQMGFGSSDPVTTKVLQQLPLVEDAFITAANRRGATAANLKALQASFPTGRETPDVFIQKLQTLRDIGNSLFGDILPQDQSMPAITQTAQ